jgi:hypothetical protein
VGEATNGGEPLVDGSRCKTASLQLNPTANKNNSIERQALLSAIPGNGIAGMHVPLDL